MAGVIECEPHCLGIRTGKKYQQESTFGSELLTM